MLERLAASFRRAAVDRDQALIFQPTAQWAESDPHLVERMVANLISNALRYTPAGGRILVAVPTTNDDPQTQLLAVLDAIDDVTRAIRLDRYLGGLVLWSRMEAATILAGQEVGASSPVPLGSVTYMARWWEDAP